MTAEIVFSNAHVIADTEVFVGSVRIQNGVIADMDRGGRVYTASIDCDGDYLMPGIVELHTDNLERHVTPRPKVKWNTHAAVLAHDAQMASAGITTVFDAVSCGDVMEHSPRLDSLTAMSEALLTAGEHGDLRADHHLHLRCEVSTPTLLDMVRPLADNPLAAVVSVMDHTPGERQFVCEKAYKTYYMGKYGFSESDMAAFEQRQRTNSARYADDHRKAVARLAHDRGFVLASHDDATAAHVDEANALGVRFLEFPTTLEAAESARAHRLSVLMGAPNLVRGGSHSGNIAAADLVKAGCLDILSSDYVPGSLIMAAFKLADESFGLTLPEAVATVTTTPAQVVGLGDRGEIAPGKRGDVIRVHHDARRTVVRATYRRGERVA